jgi:hypothetical protein
MDSYSPIVGIENIGAGPQTYRHAGYAGVIIGAAIGILIFLAIRQTARGLRAIARKIGQHGQHAVA